MDPIDRVSRALELLRRRLANPRLQDLPGTSAGGASGDASSLTKGGRPGVAERLAALNADDPQYLDRATEVFVESVLLSEFGEQFTNEPRFRQLIRGVAREMRTEPATAVQLEQLFRSMRAP
jgi:hypothetical protein